MNAIEPTSKAPNQMSPRPMTTMAQVRSGYVDLLTTMLAGSPWVFVTINLSGRHIRRKLNAIRAKDTRARLRERTLPLGQEFMNARSSGVSVIRAYEVVIRKLLHRLNSKLLGAKYKRYGRSFRSIRIYENDTKKYNGNQATHVHMLLEAPDEGSIHRLRFVSTFRALFSVLVYPLPPLHPNSPVFDIKRGRLTGQDAHQCYVLKQLVNWQVASDRVFF